MAPGARCDLYENLPRPERSGSPTAAPYGSAGSWGPGPSSAPYKPGPTAGGFSSVPPNGFIPSATSLPSSVARGSAAAVTVNLVAAAAALLAFLL